MGCYGVADSTVQPLRTSRDQELREELEGPLTNRSCRDVFFLLLFIANLGAMGYVVYRALQLGNPNKLVYGIDSWGNVCNQPNTKINGIPRSGNDMTGLSKTFYFNQLFFVTGAGQLGGQSLVVVCTKLCPDSLMTSVADLQNFATINSSKLCAFDIPTPNYFAGSLTGMDDCPPLPLVAHTSLLNRCIPETVVDALNNVVAGLQNLLNIIDENFAEKCVSDLENSWQEIVYLCCISFGVSGLMVVFLRFFAGVIIWLMVLLLACGSLAGTGYIWYTYVMASNSLNATPTNLQTAEQINASRDWLIGASVATGVTVMLLLILLILRKHIALVVQLFKEAGKAIGDMPLILIQPIWSLLAVAGSVGGFLYVFTYIETSATPSAKNGTQFVTFTADEILKYMKWYYIFGIIWVVQFIYACQHVVVAGAVASWYFARKKSTVSLPIIKSTGRLIRYHLGSVALGSLIIAIVQFIRLVLAYIQGKLKGRAGPIVDFLLKCFSCCLWCLEKILKFINANAYIMIAIYGYSFCKAARTALSVIISNAVRVAAINSVGDFVLFLGKLGTVAIVVVIGLEFFAVRTDINYVWLPIMLSSVFAYFIASCFLSVYEMTIDTIFMCFCEDCDRNDGVKRPYYMSMDLMKYVNNNSRTTTGS